MDVAGKAEASVVDELRAEVETLRKVLEYNNVEATKDGVSDDGEYAFLTSTSYSAASATRTHAGIESAAALLLYEVDANATDQSEFLDNLVDGDRLFFMYSDTIGYHFQVTGAPTANGDRRIVPIELVQAINPNSTTLTTTERDVTFEFNRVQQALAQWTLKTEVGDLSGGIGLLNDGGTVRLYMNVDRFAILDPGATDTDDFTAPFIVSGGQVYIRSAMIQDATITSAKIGSLVATKITGLQAAFQSLTVDWAQIQNVEIENADIISLSATKITGGQAWLNTLTVDLVNVTGTLAASHIDADVRNVQVLSTTSTTVGDTDVTINLNQSLTGFSYLEFVVDVVGISFVGACLIANLPEDVAVPIPSAGPSIRGIRVATPGSTRINVRNATGPAFFEGADPIRIRRVIGVKDP